MNAVIKKIKQNKKLLDEQFYEAENHETIQVDMLLGRDILQSMSSLILENRLRGKCLIMNNKVDPLGNVFNFLTPEEQKFVMRLLTVKVTKKSYIKSKTMVNAIMNPIKPYFNPLECFLEDTEVDNELEHLFNLESISMKSVDQGFVSLESEQIKNFEEDISFNESHYQVELSWNLDMIQSVPSNHSVS